METESLVYTSAECMKALNMSKDLFFKLVKDGTIPSIRVSDRKIIYSRSQIQRWINGEIQAAKPEI
jgi:predicted DNA-binding transcriptional regulator AlpA